MPMVSPTTSASVSAIAKVTASGCVTLVLERRFNVHTFAVCTLARRAPLRRDLLGRKPRMSGFDFALIETFRWLGTLFRPMDLAGKASPLLVVLTAGYYSGSSAPNQISRNSSQATLQSKTTDIVFLMRCTVSYNSWRCAPGPGYSSGRYR
jgi:hypothetical protein